MEIEEVEKIIASVSDPEFKERRIPDGQDWARLETKFSTVFPNDFKSFMSLVGNYMFPAEVLNAAEGDPNWQDTIDSVYDFESRLGRWSSEFIPFIRVGNGDYFCLSSVEGKETKVYYYYHEVNVFEEYSKTFSEWLEDVPELYS